MLIATATPIFASMAKYQTTLQFSLVAALFALAVYVSLWSGVLSLFPIAAGAIGGFSYAGLQRNTDTGLVEGLLICGAIGAVVALIASYGLLRLSSHYMAMATIATVLISRVIVLNLDSTGGAAGTGLSRNSSMRDLWIVLVLVCWVLSRLRRSKLGLAVETVREDAAVAAALGINTRNVQRIAFTMSGAIGAMAGVLQADLLQYIGPNTYYVDLGFTTLAAVVLGGAYHWLGPVIGALVFAFLPEFLGEFFEAGETIANGIMLIVIMIYLPRGLVDPARRMPWSRRRATTTDELAVAPVPSVGAAEGGAA